MKFLGNIKNWFSWKLGDTIFVRILNWFQTRHPSIYLIMLAIAGGLFEIAERWLSALKEACELHQVCNNEMEVTVAIIIQYMAIAIGVLSGTSPLSSIKDFVRPKKEDTKE